MANESMLEVRVGEGGGEEVHPRDFLDPVIRRSFPMLLARVARSQGPRQLHYPTLELTTLSAGNGFSNLARYGLDS
jgi:hypothetical protein